MSKAILSPTRTLMDCKRKVRLHCVDRISGYALE